MIKFADVLSVLASALAIGAFVRTFLTNRRIKRHHADEERHNAPD